MSPPDRQDIDEQAVIQYLLGAAPEAEAERLDELSVSDDGFAGRLRGIENDLVDAYVQGELSGETLERFRTHYLSSPRRREKVRFAESFLAARQSAGSRRESPMGSWLAFPRLAFAAGACLVLLIGLYAVREGVRFREGAERARSDLAGLERRLPPPPAPAPVNPAPGREAAHPPSMVAFLLAPPVRSGGTLPVVTVPAGTDQATFRLELEADDAMAYQAVLKDLAASTIVWRSGRLNAASPDGIRAVPVGVPAGLLKPASYSLDLTGILASGAADFIGSYSFRVALQ